MRREQDEKIIALQAAIAEKNETLRRREGILKCQLEIAHESTERVLLDNDDLQSSVDRLTREKRQVERDLNEANDAFGRSQTLCRDVEDDLEAKQRELTERMAESKAMIAMAQSTAEHEVFAERNLAQTKLEGEKEAAMTEMQLLRRELETEMALEANRAAEKLEEAEARYREAQGCITELEAQFVQAQETYEVDLHEAAMKIAQMEGELDTAALHVSRVDAEKLALEAKLTRTQQEGRKVQSELEVLLDDAESHIDQLKEEVSVMKKANTDMHAQFSAESVALREAAASAERAMQDAEYNAEATAKRLGDTVNAERTAHNRTKNEADQVQLRLRRDLQAARESAEEYHTKKVLGDMSLKMEKDRSRKVREEMHSALQSVDIMSQERDLAELRCEEIEWSSEMRCNRLVTAKLTTATEAKEKIAKQSVARKFAEDQAQLAAARARQAEDELAEIKGDLFAALETTQALQAEKSNALNMLSQQRELTEKMEEDQSVLIGYADAVASQVEEGPRMSLSGSLSSSGLFDRTMTRSAIER